MADFAPNYTARYRVTYSTLGKTHSVTWRVAASVTDPAGVAAKMGLFLGDLAPTMFTDWTILHSEFAPANSDVFLPAPSPTQPVGGSSIDPQRGSDAAVAVSWIGRSTLGGKARFFLFGLGLDTLVQTSLGKDYRLFSMENAQVSASVVRLNETAPALVANDNTVAVWYEYVNIKPNDRWVRKLRRG